MATRASGSSSGRRASPGNLLPGFTAESGSASPDRSILAIRIVNLFGRYSYQLANPRTNRPDSERLLILYGDNGSGKTTIVRLVFSLLSPAAGRGRKTFVSRTPFQQLEVDLADGTTVSARRPGSDLVGAYQVR